MECHFCQVYTAFIVVFIVVCGWGCEARGWEDARRKDGRMRGVRGAQHAARPSGARAGTQPVRPCRRAPIVGRVRPYSYIYAPSPLCVFAFKRRDDEACGARRSASLRGAGSRWERGERDGARDVETCQRANVLTQKHLIPWCG